MLLHISNFGQNLAFQNYGNEAIAVLIRNYKCFACT